jgi:hypothetical protein
VDRSRIAGSRLRVAGNGFRLASHRLGIASDRLHIGSDRVRIGIDRSRSRPAEGGSPGKRSTSGPPSSAFLSTGFTSQAKISAAPPPPRTTIGKLRIVSCGFHSRLDPSAQRSTSFARRRMRQIFQGPPSGGPSSITLEQSAVDQRAYSVRSAATSVAKGFRSSPPSRRRAPRSTEVARVGVNCLTNRAR